jgi:hypothetical protein
MQKKVGDEGTLPTAGHRWDARRLIQRLSETQEQLPSSLFIEGVGDHDAHPTFCGGFGDIYRATLKNCPVALKKIRVSMVDSATAQRMRSVTLSSLDAFMALK